MLKMNEVEITQMFPELPSYLSIFRVVDPETDNIKVRVHSRIHVSKEIEMPHGWSIEWALLNPSKFRKEVLNFCIKRYRLQKQPTRYL